MVSGIHAIVYSKQAERLREFFRDVLKLPAVDAGRGWLIYAAPPTELAVHPDDSGHHEFYLMCEDIQDTTAELKAKGVTLAVPIADRGWGLVTRLRLPSGDEIGLYQPKHPTAIGRSSRSESSASAQSKQRSRVRKKAANQTKKKVRSGR